MRKLLLGGAAVFALGLFASCKSRPSTEIVVGASTQMTRDLHAMRVIVRAASGSLTCRTIDLDRERDALETVRASASGSEPVTVTVLGYAERAAALSKDDCKEEGSPKVVRRHRTRFVEGESLFVSAPLRRLCLDVACPDGQTCVAGDCASDAIDPSTLVTYADTLVRNRTSFCFSPAKCFEDVVPALLADERDCTFRLPDEAKLDDHMNVQLLHDDLSREVLDHVPSEGFTRIDMSHFRIAPGLCRRYLSRQISALYVGANCNPKSPLAPICNRDEAIDAGVPERTLCTSGATVLPVRTAVHMLVDRTRPMSRFFGPSSLDEAIDLVLRWPLHRRTLVGLDYLPSSAGACSATQNPHATPRIGIAPVAEARPLVRAAFEDASGLAPDGPLFLDAALRENGAYAALGSVPAGDVPWRHLLLLGNRGFGPQCVPTFGAGHDLAAQAHRERGLSTSVLLLSAPPGAETFERDAYGDAVLMTRAGHGQFFDGSPDESAMRMGLATIFTSLASCLYDLPEAIVPPPDLSPVKLSYFNLLTSLREDIQHDPSCTEAGGSSGWNLEGRRVRICGKACGDLRFMLTLTAQYALERHLTPVDVPMKWAAPCP